MYQQERQQLVSEHYGLVQQIAKRMARRLPSCVEIDDLVSIGVLGLIESVDRFKDDQDASFTAYARIRIQGAIVDALRKEDFVPRSVRQRARSIGRARDVLSQRLGRSPTHEEVAVELHINVGELDNLIRLGEIYTLTSIDERRHEDGDRVGDSIASDTPTPDVATEVQSTRNAIRDAIQLLPERDQAIVRMYYYDDMSFREIGAVLGVTESRISQLHSRARRRLKEAM